MNEKITFADLIDKIAEETGASKRLVHDLLIEMSHVTKEGLNRDGHVNFPGLGRFRLKWHEARPGRNPQTGEEIEISAHSRIHFKAAVDLREYINRNYSHLKAEIIEDEIEPVESEPVDVTMEPEEPIIQPVPESYPMRQEEEKKRPARWLLLVIPLLIIVLAIIFLPYTKDSETEIEDPVVTEKISKEVPDQSTVDDQPAETEQPEEAAVSEEKPQAGDVRSGTPVGQYTVKAGDKLWAISQDFYNHGRLWPYIYRVNMNNIPNPDLLSIGNKIEVPSLQGKPVSLTRRDLEEISAGFIEAYLFYKKSDRRKAISYLWVVKKWKMNQVVDRYKDRIDDADLKTVDGIEGSPRF